MDLKIIEILENNGDSYLSPQVLAENAGIGEKQIGEALGALVRRGYPLEVSPEGGWRLIKETLETSAFKDMDTKRIGQDIICHPTLPSTNDEAKTIAASAHEGTAVLADTQTRGKGRLGRQWAAGRQSDIALSIILRPEKDLMEAVQITLLAGIAAARTIEKITGLAAKIKWPNDVVIGSKKVCGILTETTMAVDGPASMIVGIGINVNSNQAQYSGELAEKATSLGIETGRYYDRTLIIRQLFQAFDLIYDQFLEQGLSALMPDYRALCVNLGRKVSVTSNNEQIIGTAVSVSDRGELIIAREDGGEIALFSGEVSVRGLYGYV